MARIMFFRSSFNIVINRLNSTNESMTRCIHRKGLDPHEIKNDLIGPIDPVSNLRPIVFRIPENESNLEKKLRMQRDEVQKWNQHFWTHHNSNFFKQKQDFMKKLSSDDENKLEKKALSSEEMSIFYKNFLDKNWEVHLNYNKEWYKRNFKLLCLTYKVKCHKIKKKLFPL